MRRNSGCFLRKVDIAAIKTGSTKRYAPVRDVAPSLSVLLFGVLSAFLFGGSLALAESQVAPVQGLQAGSPQVSSPQVSAKGTLPAPIQEVRATLDGVIAAVEEFKGEALLAQRREKLRSVIKPRFDFDEMARRSLGPEWAKRTSSEQAEFVSVFSELLASTYLARVETVTSDMVSVDKEKVEMPAAEGDVAKAIVRTTVTNKGDTFPIDYRLQFVNGSWRVYDVIIENIGLVANYRNEFAGIIRREEFSGLMEKLRAKAGRSS